MSRKYPITMEALASLCKRRGFIFQSSEIYGGINGFWDYGPLGTEMKRNIRENWWRSMVQERDDVVGLDASIIMHPRIWEASGHLSGFSDPMVDCTTCKHRFRADHICEELGVELGTDGQLPEGVRCPHCGAATLTPPRDFNLMFKTYVGPVEDGAAVAYLRPETAQAIFAQFDNVNSVARQKIPFGIAQIGKSFRNEINPRNYTFRSREFEQMEMEFFIKPDTDLEWHKYWVDERMKWYQRVGLPKESLHYDIHAKEKLAHYAKACTDVAYEFPFGIQELEGIAARGNYDLSRHQEFSGKKLEYFDQVTGERFIPHVIEPSAGVDRIMLAILCESYREEWVPKGDGDNAVIEADPNDKKASMDGYEKRTVMGFEPCIAPFKAAVFPLLKNKPELVEKAQDLYKSLRKRWPVFYDQTGAIGRRYRRQDEIGTPFGITVDFDTLEDNTVTMRDRDSMQQMRIPMEEVVHKIEEAL